MMLVFNFVIKCFCNMCCDWLNLFVCVNIICFLCVDKIMKYVKFVGDIKENRMFV